MLVGIVFSKSSGVMSGYVFSDSGDDLSPHAQNLNEGEEIIFRDIATAEGAHAAAAAIEEREDGHHIGERCLALITEMADGRPLHDHCIEQIEKHRGKKSQSGRCVVVDRDSGEVLNVIMVCPDLTPFDAIGHPVHPHEEAEVGWKLCDDGTFISGKERKRRAVIVPQRKRVAISSTSLVDEILQNAKQYPERIAIINPEDGSVVRYGDLTPDHIRQSGKRLTLTDEVIRHRLLRLASIRDAVESTCLAIPRTTGTGHTVATQMWLAGGTVVDCSQFMDSETISDICQKYKVEAINISPARFLDMRVSKSFGFGKVFCHGTGPLETLLAMRKPLGGGDMRVYYTRSECGDIASAELDQIKLDNCVGQIIEGVSVRIDPDGRIAVKADDCTIDAYAEGDDTYGHDFQEDWFYSNDLAHFDGDMLVIDRRGK